MGQARFEHSPTNFDAGNALHLELSRGSPTNRWWDCARSQLVPPLPCTALPGHRIFKLATANMASRAAQIQKRVTMRVSGSPLNT